VIDFLLPSLGADMDEAKLVRWLVAPGDVVHKGQIIAEVETDKAVLEVECWDEGAIEELIVVPGPERMRVGTVLARIRPVSELPEVGETPVPAAPSPKEEVKVPETTAPSPPPLEEVAPTPIRPTPQIPPPIRHLAHELGVDITKLTGSGRAGAITREDVRRAARPSSRPSEKRVKASPRARQMAVQLGIDLAVVSASGRDGLITADDVARAASAIVPAAGIEESPTPSGPGEETRLEAMRRAIARSMSHSKREIPHYYLATHIDLTRAVKWLEDYNTEQPLTRRLLPAVLLLKATALALRENPELNGYWIDDHFQGSEAVHLGVAVALREGGLVAPAIHHADQADLEHLMQSLRDLVNRARSWRLRSSEMSDPTATVTNLGDRGVETGFPIIIPPQVAMVGFGKVVETPVARDGMIGVAPMVHATLSGDHRATDGHRGGLLLMSLERLLQEPERL
jgi:pyruvate dehydrogenase E2 component (dihydrolipoamide acetyltransferase)